MAFIPESKRDVKKILIAVNLRTNTRYTYLEGDGGVCPWPVEVIPNGFQDVFSGLNDMEFPGADPDVEIFFTNPPDVPPGHPEYRGDPTVYFKIPARLDAVKDLWLSALRVRAAAEADPRIDPPAGKNGPPDPGDNVIPFPNQKKPAEIPVAKKRKSKTRRNPPAKDVLKYFSQKPYRGKWEITLRAMYAASQYRNIKSFKHYPGKHDRKGRFYFHGIDELIKRTGTGNRTIQRHFAWMKKEGLIRLCHRGYPEEGPSIWELPKNMSHVFAWRKNPKIKTG